MNEMKMNIIFTPECCEQWRSSKLSKEDPCLSVSHNEQFNFCLPSQAEIMFLHSTGCPTI